jgi:tetratricopeptide (TPR) repeat protein
MPLVNRVPLMLLLIYRPERAKACWQIHEKAAREFAHCTTQITLRPLTSDSSQQLLANLVSIDHWPATVRELILSRTEGNPLYLEEVLRALIDDGVLARGEDAQWQVKGDISAFKVPDTLQGVMMTRLDRMEEPQRWTARIASVIGRVFPFDVLTYVQEEEKDDGQINQHLIALQQHEIVQEIQRVPELVYTFKHAMMQEVCYRSLLTRIRYLYHRKIAQYLESHQSSGDYEAESNYAVIAHHAFAGQDWPRALHYQLLAGQQAQRLYANQDAIGHFEKALESAENSDLDETAIHRQTIHTALGELLTVTSQFEQALIHLDQALSLTTARDDRENQAHICHWLAKLHERRGEYDSALEWIQQGLAALQGEETLEAAELLLVAGLVHTRQGNYDDALERCQDGLRISQELDELEALARAYNLLGHITRLLGMSPMAIEHFEQAFELHKRTGNLHGQAISGNQIANACFSLGRWQEAEQHYLRARDIFDQIGDAYNCAFADNNLGGIALNQGRLEEALAFYRGGLKALERISGSSYVLGVFQMNLGATFVRRGEIEPARRHLNTSQTYFEQAQVRDFLPEMHRHFAEAALLAGELTEAETHGQQALSLARELSMRSEEGYTLRVLGEIALTQSQPVLAKEHLQQSLTILEEIGDEYGEARTRLSLAKLHASNKEQGDASSMLEQCMETFDRLKAKLDLDDARALQETLN